MIVFAATPIPPSFNLKYVNRTVPTPAPTTRPPRATLAIVLDRLDVLLVLSVDAALEKDDLTLSAILTLLLTDWFLAKRPIREPMRDTLEMSVMDDDLNWIDVDD